MTLLIIYIILALIFFIGLEVFSISECNKDNAHFKFPVFSPQHFRMIICAAFFPIVILIVIIAVITESIMDGRN